MNPFKVLASILVTLAACHTAQAVKVDWEDQTLATQYAVGDNFTSQGVSITGLEFFWLPSGSTVDGFAEVDNNLLAGGSGLDMQTNNINLSFDFGGSMTSLSFLYGEYGGNINMEINGDLRNVQDFADLDGLVVGGVTVSDTPLGAPLGRVDLAGTINSFAIGGQELWIDDIDAVPEPATAALLALGGLALIRRRRA